MDDGDSAPLISIDELRSIISGIPDAVSERLRGILSGHVGGGSVDIPAIVSAVRDEIARHAARDFSSPDVHLFHEILRRLDGGSAATPLTPGGGYIPAPTTVHTPPTPTTPTPTPSGSSSSTTTRSSGVARASDIPYMFNQRSDLYTQDILRRLEGVRGLRTAGILPNTSLGQMAATGDYGRQFFSQFASAPKVLQSVGSPELNRQLREIIDEPGFRQLFTDLKQTIRDAKGAISGSGSSQQHLSEFVQNQQFLKSITESAKAAHATQVPVLSEIRGSEDIKSIAEMITRDILRADRDRFRDISAIEERGAKTGVITDAQLDSIRQFLSQVATLTSAQREQVRPYTDILGDVERRTGRSTPSFRAVEVKKVGDILERDESIGASLRVNDATEHGGLRFAPTDPSTVGVSSPAAADAATVGDTSSSAEAPEAAVASESGSPYVIDRRRGVRIPRTRRRLSTRGRMYGGVADFENLVHGNEYIIPPELVDGNKDVLDAINAGMSPFLGNFFGGLTKSQFDKDPTGFVEPGSYVVNARASRSPENIAILEKILSGGSFSPFAGKRSGGRVPSGQGLDLLDLFGADFDADKQRRVRDVFSSSTEGTADSLNILGDFDVSQYIRRISQGIVGGDTRIAERLSESGVDARFLSRTLESLNEQRSALFENAAENNLASPYESDESRAVVEALDANIDAIQQLISGLDGHADNTSRSFAGLLTGLVTALGVQQFVMARYVSQPYQYLTQPTIGAMGNTGLMGSALSGAFGAQEAVLQSYRTMGVQGAAGLGFLGGTAIGGLFKNPLLGAAASITTSAVGLGAGVFFQDEIAGFLNNLGGKDAAGEAFEANLGATLFDAAKFTGDVFSPTLQAQLAFGTNGGFLNPESDPNFNFMSVADDIVSDRAKRLNYGSVDAQRLLGASRRFLSPALALSTTDRSESTRFIDTMAALESFGMSRDEATNLMSSISMSGSTDMYRSLSGLARATSERQSDGSFMVTEYTANVLLPALAQVTESRTIQSISRSAEDVAKDTTEFYSFFKNSNTNLGKMLGTNPQVMSEIFSLVDQTSATAVQDPALMRYFYNMGFTFEDVINRDPKILMATLGRFYDEAEYDENGKLRYTNRSQGAIAGFMGMLGINVGDPSKIALVAQAFEAMRNAGGVYSPEVEAEISALQSGADEAEEDPTLAQIFERLDSIAGVVGAQSMLDFVENNNAFYTAMVDNLEAIKTVQDAMAEVFSNTKLIAEHIKNAADRQVTILNGILNSRDPRNNVTEVVKLGELTTTDPRDSNTTSTYTLSPRDLFREVTDRNSVTTIQPFTQSAQIYGLRQEGNRYVLDSAERDRYIDTRLLPISASNEELINFFVGANGAAPMLSLINFDEGGTMQVGGQMASEVINSSIVTFLQDLRREFEEGEFDANKKAVIINQLESAVAERLSQRLKTDNLQIDFPESEFATGGYTGLGNRIEPVGVVHGGEYVISDNRVTGNRRTLERMQSGENFDEIMGSSPGNFSGGEKIRVVMEFSNTNPSAIISAAKSSMRQLLLSERLI